MSNLKINQAVLYEDELFFVAYLEKGYKELNSLVGIMKSGQTKSYIKVDEKLLTPLNLFHIND